MKVRASKSLIPLSDTMAVPCTHFGLASTGDGVTSTAIEDIEVCFGILSSKVWRVTNKAVRADDFPTILSILGIQIHSRCVQSRVPYRRPHVAGLACSPALPASP